MATKMSWDWVGDYPVFVYTTWQKERVFYVKVVLGSKNREEEIDTSPRGKAYMEYVRKGLLSKGEVADDAFERVERKLLAEKEGE